MGARPWLRARTSTTRGSCSTPTRFGDAQLTAAATIAEPLGMAEVCASRRAAPPRSALGDVRLCLPPRGRVLDDRLRRQGDPAQAHQGIAIPGRAARTAGTRHLRRGPGRIGRWSGSRRCCRGHPRPRVPGSNIASASRHCKRRSTRPRRGTTRSARATPRRGVRLPRSGANGRNGIGWWDRTSVRAPNELAKRVKKAIAASLARIATQHPALGKHLAATVRTGFTCRLRARSESGHGLAHVTPRFTHSFPRASRK